MTSAMKHFEQQSYYELLEVPVTASEDQILDAYARAMETYSPDSIAVYTLADPEQLEALRAGLTQAMEVLCALEQRLEYDRKIGVTRSPEELARLREESLKRAAEVPAGDVPANGAGGPPVMQAAAEVAPVAEVAPAAEVQPEVQAQPSAEEAKPAVEAASAAEVTPEVQAQPSAEEEVLEAEVLTAEVEVVEPVAEPEQVAEAKPTAPEPASVPPAPAIPEPQTPAPAPALNEAPSNAPEAPSAPTPAAVPVTPLAARPGVLSRSFTPAPVGGLKPAIHARPMAPMTRPGSAVPPPLPPRNGLRAPVRPEAEPPRRVEPESASRDSRTRLKTVVDIPSDAEFNGELLRQVREGRSLSLQMLADRTRISSRHVENIEADRYDNLPASVYLRGMLISIARELGLDPLRVARSYMGLVASGEKKHR
ncbi:helix-turn-helix domain-containing protein [Archangium lansingense]|uniref:Helix-turn-helix domain-containing protein n=1 Tax=Archangium lansingense TaxID=2995310 RepID=A0ABT4A7X4_9BACT|nr:helix-turn-helix domain-containing protein [Archangium lansinium]MCY1077758.1 helix-turn-helix domain-containing protein [Archangium lansinium]